MQKTILFYEFRKLNHAFDTFMTFRVLIGCYKSTNHTAARLRCVSNVKKDLALGTLVDTNTAGILAITTYYMNIEKYI